MSNFALSSLKLAAFDLDGTLIAPDLTISAANLTALADLREKGVEVVVATGRHYATTVPHVRTIPRLRWLVTAQGAEVASLDRSDVIRREFLPENVAQFVAAEGEQRGLLRMVYNIAGPRYAGAAGAALDYYSDLTGMQPDALVQAPGCFADVFKVIWVGAASALDDFQAGGGLGLSDLQVVRTHDRMIEFMPMATNKGQGLAALGRRLGIAAHEVAVFGDADNDLPMFEWAGMSYAMPHAADQVKSRADRVAPEGPRAEAVARAVRDMLSR